MVKKRIRQKTFILSLLALTLVGIGACWSGVRWVQQHAEHRLERSLQKLTAMVSMAGSFHYQSIKISLWNQSAEVNGLSFEPRGKNELIRIDQLRLSDFDLHALWNLAIQSEFTVPERVQLVMSGLHIPTTLLGPSTHQRLTDLGYDEINLSASTALHFDSKNETLSIENLIFRAKNAGRFSMSMALANVPFPRGSAILTSETSPIFKKVRAEDFMAVALKSFELRYHDESLLQRISDLARKRGELDLAGLVNMIMLEGPQRNLASQGSGSFTMELSSKLTTYLKNPRAISIRSKPTRLVSLMGLATHETDDGQPHLDFLARELNLSVEVGQ
jgi:hypothetical protein